MSESFLLSAFDRVTALWVNQLSLAAIPPLRRGRQLQAFQRNRDIFILTMLSLAATMVAAFHVFGGLRYALFQRAIAATAFYRCIDIFITLVRTGVFLNFRGDVQLKNEPAWRIQRILLGVMSNYLELIALFTIVYRQVSLQSPCEFSERIVRLDQAFNLSFSTMTTTGYGKYGPDGIVGSLLTFFQVMIGIVLLVLVVGSVLALLTGGAPRSGENTPGAVAAWDRRAWMNPIFTFLACWLVLFGLAGLRLCPADAAACKLPASPTSPTCPDLRSAARPSSA